MSKIIFHFNGNEINIQCNLQEKMKDICKKLLSKISKDISKIYFIYDGNKINQDFTFFQQANEIDKKRNIMNVIVLKSDNKDENNFDTKYNEVNEIICPKCGENAQININNYIIKLFNCKNGHEINNLLLNEFEDTQFIDQSKIKCAVCNQINKSNTYQNEFFKCFTCEKYLCPVCKSLHNKKHSIIIMN